MTVSVFIGVGFDGFVARLDGGLDWLMDAGKEAHGYDEFIVSVDALVMGRKFQGSTAGLGADRR
jgi:dihydrofolate reductase